MFAKPQQSVAQLRTDSPEGLGLSPEACEALAAHEQLCQSYNSSDLLVFHKGALITERYWEDRTRDSLRATMSCTKSVVSVLFGIMADRGWISLTERVADIEPAWSNGRKASVTLEHLLTHRAGFARRLDPTGPNASVQYCADKDNYIRETTPEYEPGTVFIYSNEGVQLLGYVMNLRLQQKGTGIHDFARQFLFEPLGFNPSSRFHTYESGAVGYAGDFIATPRDLLKLGIMMMQGGVWESRRIVSEAWVKQSTSRKVFSEIPEDKTLACGYLWWTSAEPSCRWFAARGWLNNDVHIAPQQQLVIVRGQTVREENDYGVYADKLIERLRQALT